ncbi:hypothetical protein NDU88_005604 [Pleurodeles waltl]|uniref:Uncharacterized protein n=1 Tax=Pleurodeles waltl TaxID=8319 RepID=A0AAV7MAH2_PLEWA|nr:hypothetical protein NDU88_005604 [Pleurodeles waltl]
MATAIASLTMETKPMHLDIAGFQSRVTGLEHRMATMEDHVHTVLDKAQELLFLRSKLTDLEDRSQWENIHLLGFLEHAEALTHGPFKTDGIEIRITADFSRKTNDRWKGFLALRHRTRQLEVKYGLCEPARLWVTKNGVSKDFYDQEDQRLFLDSLQPQSMDTTAPGWSLRPPSTS